MIDGVVVKNLEIKPDDRGYLMEILRSDNEIFDRFGQVYVTTSYPGVIKAWHMHRRQDDNVACLVGMVKLVLFDGRVESRTHGELMELYIGEQSPALVHIPREVFHGWKCIGDREAYVINVPTELYDYDSPDEHRLPHDTGEIPYDWSIKMG